MRADRRFSNEGPEFWANVRTIAQEIGYTQRGEGTIKIPTLQDVQAKFSHLGMQTTHLATSNNRLTPFGQTIFDYFQHRAEILNNSVQHLLMDKDEAEREFNRLRRLYRPRCPLPMNKQKGSKKNHAFLTGIVNMLIEAGIADAPCDYDPRSLTTVTREARPFRTLARRVDGAFPSVVNPIAVWEVKEYYYTTTFGSRVADGIYETLLDGLELRELNSATGSRIEHILFVDAKYTWWDCGKSYLCRLVDMLHMGCVDEVLFGREVLDVLPVMVERWLETYRRTQK